MRATALSLLVVAACGADPEAPLRPASSPDASLTFEDAAAVGFEDAAVGLEDASIPDAEPEPVGREPVIFVHGINGSSAEYAVMIDRLVADGWPRDQLYTIDFEDPRWGCNADNAQAIKTKVDEVLLATGAERVDLVAHSMGTLSSREYLKHLGGIDRVNTYVTLGGLHHGHRSACLNPLPVCVWQELCPTNPFLSALNADPAAPGDTHYISICSLSDTVAEVETCHFDPAENIEVEGVDHAGENGLLEHADVYPHIKRVLEYPR